MRVFLGAFSYFALIIGILAASDDAIKALAMVNQARQAHGVPGLAWDTGLEAYAQFWANEMASGRSRFEHAQGPNRPSQGENLYEQSAGQCDAAYDNPLQTGMHAWLSQEHFYTGQPITTGHEPWLHWGELFAVSTYGTCVSGSSFADGCTLLQHSVCGLPRRRSDVRGRMPCRSHTSSSMCADSRQKEISLGRSRFEPNRHGIRPDWKEISCDVKEGLE